MKLHLRKRVPVDGQSRRPVPLFSELFAQLGLAFDDVAIAQFLATHATLEKGFRLADAPCWTISQAAFLREALTDDADWSGIVDQLNRALLSPACPAAAPTGQTRLQ
mgnify:CR=1 FL=1